MAAHGDVDRPGARAWLPEHVTAESLRSDVRSCRGCELFEPATQAVMGRGDAPARLVLLGEQPGDREDREGLPFVGPAGTVLDGALAEAGIDPDLVWTTNVVKHFRFRAGRGTQRLHQSPTRAHVAACRPWLEAEMSLVRPEGVVLLGATAGKALYGPSFKVGGSRGVLADWPDSYPVEAPPAWVVATVHPAAVLRADDQREEVRGGLVADLRVAARALADSPA